MNKHTLTLSITAALVGLIIAPATAMARCNIRNETSHSFTIASGNTSNQRVGSNTSTSIDDGTITAESDSGQSVGGSCQSGDSVVIREVRGTLVIVPR